MATQAELAELIGISDRRFRELVSEGVLPRADKGSYEPKIVVPIYCEHLRTVAAGRQNSESKADKALEDARKAKAQADLAEMEAAERKGSLVPIDEIREPLISAVAIMKTRLLSLPSKIAPQLGVKHPAEAEAKIKKHVNEALEELSKVRVGRISVG